MDKMALTDDEIQAPWYLNQILVKMIKVTALKILTLLYLNLTFIIIMHP